MAEPSRPRLLVVSGQPLWPPTTGGRLRGARLVEALAATFDVSVLAPVDAPAAPGIDAAALPADLRPGRVSAVLSPRPRLGRSQLGPAGCEALRSVVAERRPAAVLFSHSYVAAIGLGTVQRVPTVVDFVDVEVRRLRSLAGRGRPRHRLAWAAEWAKAARWEPAVARAADLCVAGSSVDADLLRAWGATVLTVPHGTDRHPSHPSPSGGPVTFVASFGYPPNADAARFLVDDVWPLVTARAPAIRLRLVGREADRFLAPSAAPAGIEVVSDPPAIDQFYDEAALVLAPVRSGGGAQLKVTEALGRGRLVVATPFSARSAPTRSGVIEAADAPAFAAAIVRLWEDTAERRRLEADLRAGVPLPTWVEVTAPLARRIADLAPAEARP